MRLVTPILIALLISPDHANGQGFTPCTLPAEPYLYKIDKQLDPEFYAFSRDEFQTYFQDTEKYLRCLESERANKIEELRNTYKIFKQNYGEDAVFKYKLEGNEE